MVLDNKVIAASDPDEGNTDDPACMCICFCDDEGEKDNGKKEESRDDCFCLCICQDDDDGGEEEEEEEEEELVDPQDTLREECSDRKECQHYKEKLDTCNARVESRSNTAETCVEEIIDFMHCVDHCVSKTLFSKLK